MPGTMLGYMGYMLGLSPRAWRTPGLESHASGPAGWQAARSQLARLNWLGLGLGSGSWLGLAFFAWPGLAELGLLAY